MTDTQEQDPVERYLAQVLADCGEDESGHVPSEAELADTEGSESAEGEQQSSQSGEEQSGEEQSGEEQSDGEPVRHALAVVTAAGAEYAAGDREHLFTIQSISKPFVYAMALDEIGHDGVRQAVGMEPSGEAFNELSLEGGTGRPLNPMINAGAIATHQLISGAHGEPSVLPATASRAGRTDEVRRRTARIIAGLSAFAGRRLQVDWATADEEYEEGYRNFAIAHMLRTHHVFDAAPAHVVRGYIDQCAVLVTVQDIARMAATLANNGVHPESGTRVISARAARQTLSVMATCGMYDASGRWLTEIGIPAKSGVSGGIIGVLPGQLGLASFAPRLNDEGNSVQGVEMFKRLTDDFGLHLMASDRVDIADNLHQGQPSD